MLAVSMDTYLQQLYPEMDSDMLMAVGMAVMAVLLVGLVFSLVAYILQAAGLYTIAKRRKIEHPWLAWLPLGQDWILGSISDQQHIANRGWSLNYKNKLLWRELALLGFQILLTWNLPAIPIKAEQVRSLENLEKQLAGLQWGHWDNFMYRQELEAKIHTLSMEQPTIGLITAVALCIAALVGIIIYTVLYYKANYNLFASCRPEQKVVFLVLSILFPVTLPFFVFACRNKDDGMPPRKVEEQPQPFAAEPVFAPVVDTAAPQETAIFSDEGTQQ